MIEYIEKINFTFQVEVSSCEEVDNVCPNTAELVQFPGRGVAITGPAREGSSCDFVTRFFSPKYGINEVTMEYKHVVHNANIVIQGFSFVKLLFRM